MNDATLTVRCACGWETTGEAAVVVADTIDHGRRLHNMEATREQVLAMAVTPQPEHADAEAHVADT
jgi:predicted small metal-binding protein